MTASNISVAFSKCTCHMPMIWKKHIKNDQHGHIPEMSLNLSHYENCSESYSSNSVSVQNIAYNVHWYSSSPLTILYQFTFRKSGILYFWFQFCTAGTKSLALVTQLNPLIGNYFHLLSTKILQKLSQQDRYANFSVTLHSPIFLSLFDSNSI